MKISINGMHYDVPASSSITQALAESKVLIIQQGHTQLETGDFVIALNQTFIPRSAYPMTHLKNNDALELLSPMAGG